VQQVGEPLELYGRPANRFVASFIGSPAMNFAEVTINSLNGMLWAESPGLRIKIPAARTEALRRHSGNKIVLGVRPEALHVATGADAGDCVFDTTVEVIEPLGNEILLDVRAGANLIVARVDPATRLKVQQSVRLALDPERLHFFDPQSEAAL
jgi:multiple sugar transport system ATP-binding protein